MNQRPALYALAARYRLGAVATARLYHLAGLDAQPDGLARLLPRGVAALGAALLGLGLVLWVAANWDSLGRFGQFALLQGVVLATCLGALALPRARAALGLAAFIGIGALFAFFGQTYQTGADPWQLFALWAALGLPLCLGVRSDLLWTPWVLVAMTAIALWSFARSGSYWESGPHDWPVYVAAWAGAALVTALLTPAAHRFTGAGTWALHTAVVLATGLVMLGGLEGLGSGFHSFRPQYWLGLLVLMGAAGILALPRTFEVAALSAVILAFDTLLVIGLIAGLNLHSMTAKFTLIGLVALGLLAGSLSAILALARHYGRGGAA